MTTEKKAGGQPLAKPTEAEFLAAIAKDSLNAAIMEDFKLYDATRDGRFLWRAIVTLTNAGERIPPNLQAMLARWADRVLNANTAEDIAAALELSGNEKRKIGPKHSAAFERRWLLASEVAQVQAIYTTKEKKFPLVKAIATVARNRGLDIAVVKSEYYRALKPKKRSATASRSAPSLDNVWGWRKG